MSDNLGELSPTLEINRANDEFGKAGYLGLIQNREIMNFPGIVDLQAHHER
jgi:hypothetical protein